MAANNPTDTGPSWYAANRVDAPERGALTFELDVDVCVVGAGLAGLTVALEVARRGWSVAVLETRRIAWNASGTNTGFVVPGFDADVQGLIEKVGLAHAKALWALSQDGSAYVRQTARAMPGSEIEESGWLHVSRTGEAGLADYASFLADELGTAAEFWPTERVRTTLRSARYFGGIHLPRAFSINPLNYALGLAAAAEAAGARIFEGTPALEIDPAGVRKRITTPSARLRAGHVVLAGNVHLGALMPRLAGTLVPIWAHVMVTEPLGEPLREVIRFAGAVTDNRLGDSDHRIVGGDRLMWSDRCTAWPGSPPRHARRLSADISRTYPQLGNVKAEYAWSGTLGATVHRMPQIGELLPGVWLASGFGGHGNNTTAMAGNIVARAIVEGSQAWQAFEPFDLVWAGGRYGRAAVQAHVWYSRAAEDVKGWLARWRKPADLPPPEIGGSGEQVLMQDIEQGGKQDETTAAPAAKPRSRRRRNSKRQQEPDTVPAGVNDLGSS